MYSLHRWLAAGLGSGWLPKAPGTWGSLVSLLPAWLITIQAGAVTLLVAALLLLAVGCWSCAVVLPELAEKDPGWIVIDEWVGQWLCMGVITLFLGFTISYVALAFVAFRVFDVLKPWPVSLAERVGAPWWSIMADDVVAGLLGAATIIGGARLLGG